MLGADNLGELELLKAQNSLISVDENAITTEEDLLVDNP